MDVLFCECSEQNWAMSAIARNRQAHITNGNQFCQQCGLFLGTWFFTNLPTKFRSWPVLLPDGMMVHHFRICKHHLALWYYRRGARIYSVYTGLAKTNLIKQLEAAGAARGVPGDHGFSPHKQFFQYQRYALQPVVKASGHEPRSASRGQRTHQNLRSELMRTRTISSYQDSGRKYGGNTANGALISAVL